MKTQFVKENKYGKLSRALIDEFGEYVSHVLTSEKIRPKDILRFRMSVEEAMYIWLDKIGEGAECSLEFSTRLGKTSIAISCKGEKCNPQKEVSEEFGMLENSSLLQTIGLTIGYTYEDGVNQISFMPRPIFARRIIPILIGLILGIGLAFVVKNTSPSVAQTINEQITTPVFTALLGLLRTISSPLIFLAVLTGVYGVGDVTTFGNIGRKIVGRFVLVVFISLLIPLAIILLTTRIGLGTSIAEANAISAIISVVLQFIPTSITSPFLEGNMLQLIFVACAFGLVMLILKDKVAALRKIFDQMFSVVQILMEVIVKLIPILIFVSMFNLVLSNEEVGLSVLLQPTIVIVVSFVLISLVIYPLVLMMKYKVGYLVLMKKIIPTFLIALSTASSIAALSSNIEVCEKELGVSRRITRFGVPLGQVIFKPYGAIEYFVIVVFLAATSGVELSAVWIITALIVSGIFSFATPPIPGGALTIFTALFLQLKIPELALPLAIGIDMIVDYIVTAGNIMSLQEELIICADKTGLLDREKLVSK